MAKKQIETIRGKRLVVNATENNLTKNEILVKEENGKIVLKERSNFGVQEISPNFNIRSFNRYFIKDLTDPLSELNCTAFSENMSTLTCTYPFDVNSRTLRPYFYLGVCGYPVPNDLSLIEENGLIEISKEDWYNNNYDSKLYFDYVTIRFPNISKSMEKRLMFLYNKFKNNPIPLNQYFTTFADVENILIPTHVDIINNELYFKGFLNNALTDFTKVRVI